MLSRRSLLSNAIWLAAGVGAAWWLRDKVLWSAPQPAFAEGGSSGWLAFASRRAGPVPTVKATVEGREINALIDSGAQYSAIDRAFAQALGLQPSFAPLVAVGASGQPQLGRGVSADVTVGGLTIEGLKAAMLELGPIAGPRGLSAPLILGQDVLRRLVADIDFPRRRLMLAAADTYVLPEGAQAAPARLQGKALAVPVALGALPLEVIVDTGASVVLALARDVAQSAGLLTGQKPRTAVSIVLGGAAAGQLVTAPEVRFAGTTYEDVEVMIFDTSRLPGFPRGLLGAGALARFRAILDHGAGTLHLLGR